MVAKAVLFELKAEMGDTCHGAVRLGSAEEHQTAAILTSFSCLLVPGCEICSIVWQLSSENAKSSKNSRLLITQYLPYDTENPAIELG